MNRSYSFNLLHPHQHFHLLQTNVLLLYFVLCLLYHQSYYLFLLLFFQYLLQYLERSVCTAAAVVKTLSLSRMLGVLGERGLVTLLKEYNFWAPLNVMEYDCSDWAAKGCLPYDCCILPRCTWESTKPLLLLLLSIY